MRFLNRDDLLLLDMPMLNVQINYSRVANYDIQTIRGVRRYQRLGVLREYTDYNAAPQTLMIFYYVHDT